MATIMDFLASILNPNPGQNRLANPQGNEPNYLTQTGLGPEQLARFHQMSGIGDQAASPAVAPVQAAPMADQQQTASVEAPQASGGGILSRIFGGGQGDGENQTIQWLQQQGMDPGTATMMAKSKPILQAYLLKRSQGQEPQKPIEINGRLVDPNDYHVIADFSDKGGVKGRKRDLTAEEVKARGYPEGSYQVDVDTGDVSTVGGAREQDPAFGREKDLRQEYENSPIVKGYQIVRDNYERIRQGAQIGSGAGDLAIVFGYMKMLDPTSVVREGEQAAASDVSGVPSRVLNLYNSVVAGAKLPPEARTELLAAAGQVYGEASKNLGDLNTRYSGIATNWQLDPNRIVQTPESYDPLSPPAEQVVPGAPVQTPAPSATRKIYDDLATGKPEAADGWREVAPGVKLRKVN